QVIFLRPGPPTEQHPILTASLTVFFENGSAELEPFYKGLLKNFAQVDLACNIHELEFTGTASSAPFSTDNEKRNPRLANLRVAAVKREINKYTKDKVRFNDTPWTTETLMAPHRWIRDTEKSTRVLATEPFNRRVDILMHSKGDCELPGNAA